MFLAPRNWAESRSLRWNWWPAAPSKTVSGLAAPCLPAEAVDAVLQIIAGLEVAQRIGILHRNVKPSNCFVDADGTVKIGDFGLSISTAVRTETALTAAGSFLGTPAFCSPEQLRGEELNARSDMYSVGATLFYLLTGRTPFAGEKRRGPHRHRSGTAGAFTEAIPAKTSARPLQGRAALPGEAAGRTIQQL